MKEQRMIETAIHSILAALALPKVGLASVFVISLISATLLPLGSEPAVFAVVMANPHMFWLVIVVATAGNTLGGIIDYWLGYGTQKAFYHEQKSTWFAWLNRFGAKTMLLAWLPIIGDPICTVGGWLRLPFWPCVAYMAIGKFLRYLAITYLLLHVPPGFWHSLARVFG